MAFPQTSAPTVTVFSSSINLHDVNLPPVVNAGDGLLLIFATADNRNGVDVFSPGGGTGFEVKYNSNFSTRETVVWIKVADGDEGGGTVTVQTDLTVPGIAHVYRITDWFRASAGVEVAGQGNTLNPPSLTPTWGAGDTLWFACGSSIDDDGSLIFSPAGYTDAVFTNAGAGTNNSGYLVTARRELSAASEDPGSFSVNPFSTPTAFTIAVREAASASGSPMLMGL